MNFLLESTHPAAVIDDVLADLRQGKHPLLLGLLLESKLLGVDPLEFADELSEDELDELAEVTMLARLEVAYSED